ncbi:fatty-acyl-CoA synthase [Burkholderiaceae bacterium]|nr:fatty-acyl-CoA synthase [Burkholderiaceae bacterium]
MLLHSHFEETCRRLPHKLALVCGEQRLSYGELAERVEGLAATLQQRGVRRGDRVALYLDSSIDFAVAVHAVLRIGGVFMPISSLTKREKLAYMLNDTRASALLTQQRLADAWRHAVDASPSVHTCVVRDPAAGDGDGVVAWPEGRAGDVAPTPLIDQDLAAIIYTSGTTGLPKGVMLSHLNMCSAWRSVQSYLGLREDDVIGLALSPAFSYGLYHVLMGLGLGATVVLERAASFPVKVMEGLVRERVSVFPGLPTLFSSLLGLSNLSAYDLSAVRIVTNAAAALPDELSRRLREALPNARLYSMYGMTECKRISYLPPEELAHRPTSVGRGMANQEYWLVDEQGQRLPNGSVGQLVVRGSHVMRGYWEKPEETAERLKPGPTPGERVLYTGDIFRTDDEGWLYFVARGDDIIKSRGEKVAPREVENAIYAIEGVVDCAVIGVPDELLGQAVKAFVTVKPGCALTEREIIRHCLATLENYMAPKSVSFVAELPRTDSGKIRKVDLR